MEAHTRETRAGNGGGARGARASTFLLGAVICAVVGLVSCRRTPPDGGETRPPPARRAWWNYYERGVQASASGDWDDAKRDFEVCLGLRSGAKYGYAQERWHARTYGVRFVKDYFPHRELGLALLKLGDARTAARELEESLRQEPSGRAKYYLNEAMKSLQEGRLFAPPVITLDDALVASGYGREQVVRLCGRVVAEGRVSRIEVGGSPEFIELAEPSRKFSKEVRLIPGTNLIRIVAADLQEKISEKVVQRIADWRAPMFSVRSAEERGGQTHVEGSVYDDFALRSVHVKGLQSVMKQTRRGADSVSVSLVIAPEERPVLDIADEAGNLLSVDVRGLLSRLPQAVAFQSLGAGGFAGSWRAVPLGLASPFAGDSFWRFSPFLASAGTLRDSLKPTLRLAAESESVRVYVPEYYIEGEAGDPGGLASVTVGGQEYLRPAEKGAKTVSFGGTLPLDLGTNLFDVVAEDLSGNRNARKIVVICAEPKYKEAAYRLAAGIPPFQPPGDTWAWQARARLQKEFTRLPSRFRLLERDEGWDYVMRELNLTASELADPRAALRIGKLLSAELLFVGAVLNQGNGVTVQVRAVDSAEGRIVLSADIYAERPERDLAYQLGGLFLKITQGFPIAEGHVLDTRGEMANIDVGTSQGIRIGSTFIIIGERGSGTGAGGGNVLTMSGRAVCLEVDRLSTDSSRVRVLPPEAATLLQKGDCVYAR